MGKHETMSGIFMILILSMLISSCSVGTRLPHENFKEIYGNKVGSSADDPHLLAGGYPKKEIGNTTLPNGSIEVEYDMKNPWGHCRIYYQIDPRTRTIIGWRFEGSEKACSVPP